MKTNALAVVMVSMSTMFAQGLVARGQATGDRFGFEWGRLPDLPDTLGVAGAFVGVSNGVLIVAGGSNFNEPLWAGGKKRFLNDIRVLRADANNGYGWLDAGILPKAVSNGSAVSIPSGILCLGGTTIDGDVSEVFLLRWHEGAQKVERVPYPSLPVACSYTAAVAVDETVYLAGGKNSQFPDGMRQFWRLDTRQGRAAEWEPLQDLPAPHFNGLLFTQQEGQDTHLYHCSGKSADRYSTAVYAYPVHQGSSGRWIAKSNLLHAALAATAVPYGKHQVLLFGGSDGHDIGNRLALKDGYHLTKRIMMYHAVNDTWHYLGDMPIGIVATTAVYWNGVFVFPGGELGNAMRTNQVLSLRISNQKNTSYHAPD